MLRGEQILPGREPRPGQALPRQVSSEDSREPANAVAFSIGPNGKMISGTGRDKGGKCSAKSSARRRVFAIWRLRVKFWVWKKDIMEVEKGVLTASPK